MKRENIEARVYSETEELDPTKIGLPQGHCSIFTRSNPSSDYVNEDSMLVLSSPKCSVLAVADGVGGSKSGNKASKLAVESLKSEVCKAIDEELQVRTGIINGFEKANEKILELGTGAATTMCVAEISGTTFRSYHVGDSFSMIIGQKGKLKYQTIDHSPVGYALEAGIVSEKDAISHDDRHIITNFLGDNKMRIDVGPEIKLSVRDTVIVGSDGVTDNVLTEELINILRKGKIIDSTKELAAMCHGRMLDQDSGQASKPDDLTFILYRPKP